MPDRLLLPSKSNHEIGVELIDTHAHLYLKDFGNDIEMVMARAVAEGVKRVYLPALDRAHMDQVLDLETRFPEFCVAMSGLHPCYVGAEYAAELEFVTGLLASRRFAAVGEIGLDYYWDRTFEREQKIAFEQQMELAVEHGLPVVIHSRSAMDDTIGMLRAAQGTGLRGIFHCFSGSAEEAQAVIECGLYLGIGGVVTYKNAGLDRVVAELPLERIVLETDAPYLTPVPFRGKRNESSYLRYIVQKIAEIKQLPVEEVARITTENAREIFG